ncbi:hypothetical protein [Niemeyer virus]|uniref:Uncharacterized protein n=1 Tax=Acanthamoeba polyphaga mimivirus Kroon TaxID=3069720 RepID=A0A0G2Y2A5_9VIRU|nr:hypothetical protein QJ850_gp821 [Acanthamoeba polyphaga mimivirus]AKI79878.1 hypothetical protein [Acanthamoeba polyphaga mimivirus Kroon]ALR83723.1 hypothetical protein [Niemeyer virus]
MQEAIDNCIEKLNESKWTDGKRRTIYKLINSTLKSISDSNFLKSFKPHLSSKDVFNELCSYGIPETNCECGINDDCEHFTNLLFHPFTYMRIIDHINDLIRFEKQFIDLFNPNEYSIKFIDKKKNDNMIYIKDLCDTNSIYVRYGEKFIVEKNNPVMICRHEIFEGFIFDNDVEYPIGITLYMNGSPTKFTIKQGNMLIEGFYLIMMLMSFTNVTVEFDKDIECRIVYGYLRTDVRRHIRKNLLESYFGYTFEFDNNQYTIINNNGICSIIDSKN